MQRPRHPAQDGDGSEGSLPPLAHERTSRDMAELEGSGQISESLSPVVSDRTLGVVSSTSISSQTGCAAVLPTRTPDY